MKLYSRVNSSFCIHALRSLYAFGRLYGIHGAVTSKIAWLNSLIFITTKWSGQSSSLHSRFFSVLLILNPGHTPPGKNMHNPSCVHKVLNGNCLYADRHKTDHLCYGLLPPYQCNGLTIRGAPVSSTTFKSFLAHRKPTAIPRCIQLYHRNLDYILSIRPSRHA